MHFMLEISLNLMVLIIKRFGFVNTLEKPCSQSGPALHSVTGTSHQALVFAFPGAAGADCAAGEHVLPSSGARGKGATLVYTIEQCVHVGAVSIPPIQREECTL